MCVFLSVDPLLALLGALVFTGFSDPSIHPPIHPTICFLLVAQKRADGGKISTKKLKAQFSLELKTLSNKYFKNSKTQIYP